MPFIPKSGRDAWSTIAGFVLQVDFTILRWLNLENGEVLELECGEDIDTIQEQLAAAGTDETRLMEQITRESGTLTLRTPKALQAMVNFCEARQSNPRTRLSFRFVTTNRAGTEQGWKRDASGIETWERIRRGDFAEQDRVPALEAIRSVLKTTTKPSAIPAAEWQRLQDLISSDEELADFITAFQWSVASSDYLAAEEEIKSGLIQFGYASDNEDAEDLFERLFLSVFKRLRVSGRKRLTPEDLHSEVEQRRPISRADRHLVGFIRSGLIRLEQKMRELEENVAQSTARIEALSVGLTTLASRQDGLTDITFSAQEVFLDVPDLVRPLIPRQNAVDEIIDGLPGVSIFSVVGEPGAGKTQLCLLVAQRLKRPLIWVSIPRDYSVQQASTAIDGLIASITKRKRPTVLRPWYEEAARALGDGLLVIDNLPRTTQGDPLARRIDLLGELLVKNDRVLLLISYYDLPRSTGEALKVGRVEAPRLTDVEITDLLIAHGAPPEFAAKLTTLVSTATRGLPVLVAALARFFAGQDWELSWEQIESVLKAEFATSARQDARDLIRLTVPDAESRELIYRLALTIGGFSRATVERIARVPRRLNLPNEKLEALTGVWVQPFVGTKFILSPLIDHSVAADLDDSTRKGVHATLAFSITSQRVLEPLDVIAALFHFSSAGLVNPAAILLIQALSALTETDGSPKDEWGVSNLWLTPLSEEIDINLRVYLRALQVVALDEQGKDTHLLRADLDRLLQDAGETSWGTAIASSLIAIRFSRKYPALANAYLLMALRALEVADLPNGSRIPQSGVLLAGLFWATGISASSDSDVESWIASVRQLNRDQIRTLATSEMADLATILPDGVWHREYLAKDGEGDWDRIERLVKKLEDLGREVGLRVLEVAAIRTRIMILAEWRHDMPSALQLAESSLGRFDDDASRFLITEVTGRHFSYAKRSSEAIEWLSRARSFPIRGHTLWRRNVLITLAQEEGKTNASLATTLTSEALEITRDEPSKARIVEALAEHSIALWNSGQQVQSFERLEEAVRELATMEGESDWKALLLALFQVAIYLSSLAYHGHPPTTENFVPPTQGMFLGLGSFDITKFNPAQKCFIRIRMAMLAEGLGRTKDAGVWSDEALDLASEIPEARTIYALGHLSIAPALLEDNYNRVVLLARMLAEANAPSSSVLTRIGLNDNSHQRAVQEFFSHPATAPMAMLQSMVPVAFRLGTLKLGGMSEEALGDAIDKISSGLSGFVHQETIIASLRASFVGDISLVELRQRSNELVPRLQDTAAGMICMIGLATRAPLAQSLHDQVWLLQNVEKLFVHMPSIRREIVYPFFKAFWTRALSVPGHTFRTSEAYTRQSIDSTDAHSAKSVKQLLRAMAFCLGVTMSEEIDEWLSSEG